MNIFPFSEADRRSASYYIPRILRNPIVRSRVRKIADWPYPNPVTEQIGPSRKSSNQYFRGTWFESGPEDPEFW
jgi:hypothetical protein